MSHSPASSAQTALTPRPVQPLLTDPVGSALPDSGEVRGNEWLPLAQAWLPDAAGAAFRAGWFRLRWSPRLLVVDSVFMSPRPRNAARNLNEPTWELGEVAETFIEEDGSRDYLEIHVTPENQRLQLRFPHGGIERLRSGAAALTSFLISDAAWAQSFTCVRRDHWASRLILPASGFRAGFLSEGRTFLGNFSRYDCADAGDPILSATAPLTEPSYHRRHEWQTFRFSERSDTRGGA